MRLLLRLHRDPGAPGARLHRRAHHRGVDLVSLIEHLRPCACGRCDAYTAAAHGAEQVHSDALWRGGMRAHVANELSQLVAHGSLFSMGRTSFERWTA